MVLIDWSIDWYYYLPDPGTGAMYKDMWKVKKFSAIDSLKI